MRYLAIAIIPRRSVAIVLSLTRSHLGLRIHTIEVSTLFDNCTRVNMESSAARKCRSILRRDADRMSTTDLQMRTMRTRGAPGFTLPSKFGSLTDMAQICARGQHSDSVLPQHSRSDSAPPQHSDSAPSQHSDGAPPQHSDGALPSEIEPGLAGDAHVVRPQLTSTGHDHASETGAEEGDDDAASPLLGQEAAAALDGPGAHQLIAATLDRPTTRSEVVKTGDAQHADTNVGQSAAAANSAGPPMASEVPSHQNRRSSGDLLRTVSSSPGRRRVASEGRDDTRAEPNDEARRAPNGEPKPSWGSRVNSGCSWLVRKALHVVDALFGSCLPVIRFRTASQTGRAYPSYEKLCRHMRPTLAARARRRGENSTCFSLGASGRMVQIPYFSLVERLYIAFISIQAINYESLETFITRQGLPADGNDTITPTTDHSRSYQIGASFGGSFAGGQSIGVQGSRTSSKADHHAQRITPYKRHFEWLDMQLAGMPRPREAPGSATDLDGTNCVIHDYRIQDLHKDNLIKHAPWRFNIVCLDPSLRQGDSPPPFLYGYRLKRIAEQ